jgi:hypothetical protein
MAEIMTPGPGPGGWVIRFRDTGRYYVTDEVADTDDLDRAVAYTTQAEARGVVDHIKQSWVDPGPLDVVSLTAARVEVLTGRDQPKQAESGGWLVRFTDTGRYYVAASETDTDDLNGATTYPSRKAAYDAVAHVRETWANPGPVGITTLMRARVETPTRRVSSDPPMQQLKPKTDADLEALKYALGWDPRGEVPIDQRTLPTELEHMLRVSMPPGNLMAGGFEGRLVSLFADADPWNFVRLAQGFPLHGVAVVLWDAGLVYSRSASRDVGWGADWKLVDDRALWTWLKRPDKTWRQKFDGVRFILNSPRTSSQGRQVSLPEVDHGR